MRTNITVMAAALLILIGGCRQNDGNSDGNGPGNADGVGGRADPVVTPDSGAAGERDGGSGETGEDASGATDRSGAAQDEQGGTPADAPSSTQ